ncbi:hypothetical protein OG705_17615 [Streptomyces sp. NBC_00838]|uniref:hypothetical protein n=1 Tax=Streptomyces sp. NBC_00838 TaxID=2903680 RepID=UPI003863C00E|nr:hypothetical protein OG705_17615 [Streptomyces sp. NBC_00838]
MKRLRSRGRAALVAAAAMCAVVAQPAASGGPVPAGLPGLAGTAAAAEGPTAYEFDKDAGRLEGGTGTGDAGQLDKGATHLDSIEPGKKLFYQLDLDDAENAYVSVTAVPGLESRVDYGDKITVRMQDGDGKDCDSEQARVLPTGDYPQPLTASVSRTLTGKKYGACRGAGTYHVIVERESKPASSQEPWELELRFLSEPPVKAGGSAEAPEEWPTVSPGQSSGTSEPREGGAGFSAATSLGGGEWTAGIEPGESLFYRVPVDWGQQLFATAELGGSDGDGIVTGAMSLAVYNPARGLVDSTDTMSYNGEAKSTSTDPAPPVFYGNRFKSAAHEKAMRFAGWYYLRVSLNPEVGEKFGQKSYGLTLRVDVEGSAEDGPEYDGPAEEFNVSDENRDQADTGENPRDAEDSGTMTLVAAGGIGTGTVLVLGLGGWALLARRREAGR